MSKKTDSSKYKNVCKTFLPRLNYHTIYPSDNFKFHITQKETLLINNTMCIQSNNNEMGNKHQFSTVASVGIILIQYNYTIHNIQTHTTCKI